ncbi:hypothetical protein PZB74_20730 [Porifericola rhodea]|uniref:hypothetical protein n=1 Tax=Porifericola rhodea TaxID=930972 RepID=UPI0026667A49|nr:hypothetical protein [Porifericola rhodea]WKN31378.1 hypothetical protein PZB74_20730 [Porifericola rhodea]
MKLGFDHIDKSVLNKQSQVQELVKNFLEDFNIQEKEHITIHTDNKTLAFYIECHISAKDICKKGTIDVPLDPENQSDYRANREVVENNPAYQKMVQDAEEKRIFSNIVAEYNPDFEPEKPLKIIGGQHRFLAIEKALKKGVNEFHGFKLYFDLSTEQRLDVQLISNTNIAVSNDLLDRMFETVKGPELRDWCQKCGILEEGQDFADKKQRGSQISVRGARTLIVNYIKGKHVKDVEFNTVRTTPVITTTGGVDEEWETIRQTSNIWTDKKMIEMGKAYAGLVKAQKDYFSDKDNFEFSEKALSYSVLASWSFVAGVLNKNKERLKRHYELSNRTSADPLNSSVLAKGRHKTDPENYRGLGTRTDVKDRGRLAELFFLQAEKGTGINKKMVDLAVEKYHAKEANLRVQEMEKKL